MMSIGVGDAVVFFPQPSGQQSQRVVPKGIDFNGFAATRRNDPVTHLRIHPGELIILLALSKKAVFRINMDIKVGAAEVMLHDIDQPSTKEDHEIDDS